MCSGSRSTEGAVFFLRITFAPISAFLSSALSKPVKSTVFVVPSLILIIVTEPFGSSAPAP
jgi:hypothetical protein